MLAARVNLKGWQQVAVAVGSAFGALLDPKRADLIAALGETTGKPAFERVLQRMKNSAEGRVSPHCPFSYLNRVCCYVWTFVAALDHHFRAFASSMFCRFL